MSETESRDTAAQTYTMGYSDGVQQLLRRRSATTNAAYLLPHLRSGMRLLDFGCGPGTISVGLARAVEPGALFGIDVEASQIAMARSAASAGGHSNMEFQIGDVMDLPFEDAHFDIAHGHAVLNHVPDTQATLVEIKRVLKPGGLVASRELICDSSFLEPRGAELGGGWEAFTNLLAANGGHPQMGKQLKGVFQEAGDTDIEVGVTFEYFASAKDVDFYHGFVSRWICGADTAAAAVRHGLAEQQHFDGWRRALDVWKEEPGAIAALAWGEALGRKP